jgi:hypothetical protein
VCRWYGRHDATEVCEHPSEILQRDATVSQESRWPAGIKGNDTRLNANLRRLTKQHRVDAPIKLFEYVFGGGGREASEAIRTWRSDRRSGSANESQCRFVSRETHADGLQPSADQPRNLRSCRGNDRECTWPESVRQESDTRIGKCVLSEETGKVGSIGNVHDEWIKRWATLRLKDSCNSWGIEGVRSEAVHGFGGEGDKSARANDRRSARHRFSRRVWRARSESLGDHAGRATSIDSAA